MEFRNGKVVHETPYFADSFEAPEWRKGFGGWRDATSITCQIANRPDQGRDPNQPVVMSLGLNNGGETSRLCRTGAGRSELCPTGQRSFDRAVMTLRIAESDEKYVVGPLDLVAARQADYQSAAGCHPTPHDVSTVPA
jgi:hypothetical protein